MGLDLGRRISKSSRESISQRFSVRIVCCRLPGKDRNPDALYIHAPAPPSHITSLAAEQELAASGLETAYCTYISRRSWKKQDRGRWTDHCGRRFCKWPRRVMKGKVGGRPTDCCVSSCRKPPALNLGAIPGNEHTRSWQVRIFSEAVCGPNPKC